MAEFVVKTNDDGIPLSAILSDADGVVNLTGYTVVFSMQLDGATVNKVDAQSCTITDAAAGTVQYDWDVDAGDLDTAGTYKGEFVATSGTGKVTTFPRRKTDSFITIYVKDSV